MRGVVLDRVSGRPVDNLMDGPYLSEETLAKLPDYIVNNLKLAKANPRAKGPTATKQGFYEVLAVDLADGAQIAASAAEAIICPDYTFAAYDPHIYPGATFDIECYFDASFVITTPGTLTFRLRWGGVAGTVLAATGAYAPDPTAALANRSGRVHFKMVWRTVGSAGSAFVMGDWGINDFDDASATSLQGNLNMSYMGSAGANTPAVVTALDTTTSKALSVTAQFSVATAGTQLTNHIRTLASLN